MAARQAGALAERTGRGNMAGGRVGAGDQGRAVSNDRNTSVILSVAPACALL